jgi:hypothetical protein
MTIATPESPFLPLSVIMPVGKRHARDIAALYSEYRVGLDTLGIAYEFIVVLDGPRPEIAATLQRLLVRGDNLIVISLTNRDGARLSPGAGCRDRQAGERAG